MIKILLLPSTGKKLKLMSMKVEEKKCLLIMRIMSMMNATHMATSTMKKEVLVVDPTEVPGAIYFMPTPKSPHGCDVDPSGEYIVGSGKLAAELTVHSFSKMLTAIENKDFDGDAYGIPILSYEATLAGAVKNPGLGPLHTEFDGKGNAYTTFFISSEVVKWKLGTWEVLDRQTNIIILLVT